MFQSHTMHLTLRVKRSLIMKEVYPNEIATEIAKSAVGRIDCFGKSSIEVAVCAVGAVIDGAGNYELECRGDRIAYQDQYRLEMMKHFHHLVGLLREAGVVNDCPREEVEDEICDSEYIARKEANMGA